MLTSLGWAEFFSASFEPFSRGGFLPARVVLQHKDESELLCAAGPIVAGATGRLRHAAATAADLPVVGDWVAVKPRPGERRGDIHAVLPRRTKFSRQAPGGTGGEQVVAANIDTVFLVTAADRDFNPRRLERYVAVARESGAQPVVVINKCDLPAVDRVAGPCFAPSSYAGQAAPRCLGVPVLEISALQGEGLEALGPWLVPHTTVALLGSSGVGKSTLINRIIGAERLATGAISEAVGKGRHTTTHRELVVAPSGVLVIDTPGMRELQLWDVDAAAVDATFADIAELAARCRFRDCAHGGEPGCAIEAALDDGSLEPERWTSYLKLQREQSYQARRADKAAARVTKEQWKRINKQMRQRRVLE